MTKGRHCDDFWNQLWRLRTYQILGLQFYRSFRNISPSPFSRDFRKRVRSWTETNPLTFGRIGEGRRTKSHPPNLAPFFHPYTPCMLYLHIFTYIWLIFMVNVGKYSSPMDASWVMEVCKAGCIFCNWNV